jgi:hypothetical protein
MRATTQHLGSAILASAIALSAAGQTSPTTARNIPDRLPASAASSATQVPRAVEQLHRFTDSDIKFKLRDLMRILRDHRHEAWVLAAYPDPKTGHPLIGAGFSLDLPSREHPQRDPLNPHPFLEPSSAELWQAAGLDSERLQTILEQYDDRLATWSKNGFRKKMRTLTPQISNEEATLLLRLSVIQAIYNAKGYCRNFDQLTASQQMALSQLVYQMGVNLEGFSQFLDLINNYKGRSDTDAAYWEMVQQSLIESQWARLYRTRAVSVIAMLDPRYANEPGIAEQRLGAILRPAVAYRRIGRPNASRQHASNTLHAGRRHAGSTTHKVKFHPQKKHRS